MLREPLYLKLTAILGGAAIAIANARASVSSQQIIKFAGFYVLFLLFFFFFLSENVSTTKSEVIDQRFFALSISFLHFLFVEFESQKSLGRQLTWNVNKDKSIAFNTVNLLNKFRKQYSLNHFLPSCFSLCKVFFIKSIGAKNNTSKLNGRATDNRRSFFDEADGHNSDVSTGRQNL